MEIASKVVRTPTDAATRGTRQRGRLRVKNILEVAQQILADEGYHSLTLRKIAHKLGISSGNVTYYFANKEQLLKAIIVGNLARYEEMFEREASSYRADPKSRVRAYFTALIADAQNSKSQRFFYQLWALSSHNEEAARQRDGVYAHFRSQLLVQLTAVRPDLDDVEILRKSVVLMSLIEGLNVICGSGGELRAEMADPGPWVLDEVMAIIER